MLGRPIASRTCHAYVRCLLALAVVVVCIYVGLLGNMFAPLPCNYAPGPAPSLSLKSYFRSFALVSKCVTVTPLAGYASALNYLRSTYNPEVAVVRFGDKLDAVDLSDEVGLGSRLPLSWFMCTLSAAMLYHIFHFLGLPKICFNGHTIFCFALLASHCYQVLFATYTEYVKVVVDATDLAELGVRGTEGDPFEMCPVCADVPRPPLREGKFIAAITHLPVRVPCHA
jgi:hypothetical protein